MIRVKATYEGLIGKPTSTGYVIDKVVSFVALPSTKARWKHVRVQNPANGKKCIAQVLDVGPWNTDDDSYVFQLVTQPNPEISAADLAANGFKVIRPAAESGHSVSGNGTNGAGIDLGYRVWHDLGMTDNSDVEWEFIS